MSDGVLGFRVYRRLRWSSGAHPSAHRRGERGCQNLSDVSGQRRWLGFPWRTAAALSFWALSVILRRRSWVLFLFSFWEKDDGVGRSLVLVPLRSRSVFSCLILTALLVAIYQGLEGGHFCFSPSFLFSRVSLLSVRNVMPQFYNLLTLWNLKRIDCLFVSSFGSSNSQAKHVTSNRGALWDMELSRLDEKEQERETVVEDVSVFVFLFPRGFLDWV